jgi:hypothetical protein
MATPENLKIRLQLISRLDQLASRLDDGDETAIDEARDHLCGLIVSNDTETLALVMKALASVLEGFQGEVDANSWRYTRE